MFYTCHIILLLYLGFSDGSDGKESACNAEDPGLIPGLGRSPGEGNGTPLRYPCLDTSMDRGAWWATIHGVTKSLGHNGATPTRREGFLQLR